jgi:hypothetical protein
MANEGDSGDIVHVVTPLNTKYYGNVNVHAGTLDKIKEFHPEEFGRLPEVYETIAKPTKVYQSRTNDRSVIVVNDKIVSANSASPLWAIVKRVSDEEAILTSAYFNRTNNPGEELE